MEITEVKVFPIQEEKLKAFVSVVFDQCFMVNDIKIIQGRDGLFISMPSRKKKNGEFKDVAHPLNNETRRTIEEKILTEYERVLGERGERLPASPHVAHPAVSSAVLAAALAPLNNSDGGAPAGHLGLAVASHAGGPETAAAMPGAARERGEAGGGSGRCVRPGGPAGRRGRRGLRCGSPAAGREEPGRNRGAAPARFLLDRDLKVSPQPAGCLAALGD
jgi:stage V sporulation protein G